MMGSLRAEGKVPVERDASTIFSDWGKQDVKIPFDKNLTIELYSRSKICLEIV